MIIQILTIEDPDNQRLNDLLDSVPDFLSEMKVEPVFAFGFPKDKMDELNRAQMELNLKLGTRREIMERMGKQNVPELLQEIDDDLLQQGEIQARINQMQAIAGMMGGSSEGEEYGEGTENSEETEES